MNNLTQYTRKPNKIFALQLTEPKTYQAWGGTQHAKVGDWWVNNNGEEYSIDQESFAKTYTRIEADIYTKTGDVWAYVATEAGKVKTEEGFTEYEKGDYIVANNPDGTDAYANTAEYFNKAYVEVK